MKCCILSDSMLGQPIHIGRYRLTRSQSTGIVAGDSANFRDMGE